MNHNRLHALPLALGLGVVGAAGAVALPVDVAAAASHPMAPVTESGKLVKVVSSSEFSMSVGTKTYLVKVDDMTHITLEGKKVGLSTLKKGDSVTVKGPIEMGIIDATTVTAGM